MTEDWQSGGFGLYVHWPFCEAKCPYCDFNSHVTREIDHRVWLDSYLSELKRTARETPNRVLKSIFFGGGTPSLMKPDTVASIVHEARSLWTPANDIEITLEANPGSVEAGRFAGYRDGGVNRISMGIQALNDRDLKRLGRIHTVNEARTAFDIARDCFDRVSFDLIYARQDQTPGEWKDELDIALSMAVDHLSLYQLSIETGTAFGDRFAAGKLRGLPDDDRSVEMYELTQDLCEQHGLIKYEVSNHARPDAISRHNMIYWTGGDYVGIGPGAHGRVTLDGVRYATESTMLPKDWLDRVSRGNGESLRNPLSGLERAEEYLMMGLRLKSGILVDRYEALSGLPLDSLKRKSLVDLGMIHDTGEIITVSKQGVMVLNAIISELLVG